MTIVDHRRPRTATLRTHGQNGGGQVTATDVVSQGEFGAFKAETRRFQSGLATSVMELQDASAKMETGLATAQSGLTMMQSGLAAAQKTVAEMADLLSDGA